MMLMFDREALQEKNLVSSFKFEVYVAPPPLPPKRVMCIITLDPVFGDERRATNLVGVI